jgi:hypothetical protein
MASYGEFMRRQVSLEEYVLGRDSSAVKSRVESVKDFAKKENATSLKKFLDNIIESEFSFNSSVSYPSPH